MSSSHLALFFSSKKRTIGDRKAKQVPRMSCISPVSPLRRSCPLLLDKRLSPLHVGECPTTTETPRTPTWMSGQDCVWIWHRVAFRTKTNERPGASFLTFI
jgi:hypothetical protein